MPSPGVVGGDEEAGRQEAGQHKHEHHLVIHHDSLYKNGKHLFDIQYMHKFNNEEILYFCTI